MPPKSAKKLIEPLELEVVGAEGVAFQYVTTPFDVWRAERLTGLSAADALIKTFTGYTALAWSCALRAGHATRPKGRSDQEAFEAWLAEVGDVRLISEDDDAPEDDAGPLDDGSPEGSPP